MEEKLKKVKQILKDQNQEHLLNYSIENKEEIMDRILTINFEQLNKLYEKAIKKEEIAETKIDPISCIKKDNLTQEEKDNYEKTGEKLIKEGKYAAVTMAGGQRNKASDIMDQKELLILD